jgi:hypothetical protein
MPGFSDIKTVGGRIVSLRLNFRSNTDQELALVNIFHFVPHDHSQVVADKPGGTPGACGTAFYESAFLYKTLGVGDGHFFIRLWSSGPTYDSANVTSAEIVATNNASIPYSAFNICA